MDKNFILCPFDNGIRVMQQFSRGVYGAANAPAKIFSYLFPDKTPTLKIPVEPYNTGKNEDNYKGHKKITNFISKIKNPFYVLGGDHSITYPIVKGLCKNKKLGLIYFDAHYDMRPLEGPNKDILSSGNSFYRIIKDKALPISGENMVVIGIKKGESEIFKKMDNFARKKRVTTFYLNDVKDNNYMKIMKKAVEIANRGTNGVYLSIDIDGVDSKFAPGCSCPTDNGMPVKWIKDMIKSTKFVAGDVVEASNRERSWKGEVDEEGDDKLEITAKTAADIIGNVRFKLL